MLGPNLDLLLKARTCSACGVARRRLFNVDTSRLADYTLIYHLCVYCKARLHESSYEARSNFKDQVPFFVVNAHGWRTTRARQEAVRDAVASRQPSDAATAEQEGTR